VSTYRHLKGGGRVVGLEAYVSPDSYFDAESSAEGRTLVFSSFVRQSALKDSAVSGPDLRSALLDRCVVARTDEEGPPFLSRVALRGVRVEGNVILRGPWAMECSGAWIHAGEWARSPIHRRIEGENGVGVALVECTEGRAHCGCKCRRVAHWLERGPAVGRRLGWTEEQIEAARLFFEGLR
jgi:hypothetical protein